MSSFLTVANDSDFSLHNLPFGVIRHQNQTSIATRLGDQVIKLAVLSAAGALDLPAEQATLLNSDTLNDLMAAGQPIWRGIRQQLSTLLAEENPQLRDNAELCQQAIIPVGDVTVCLPARIGDYTDFYSSKQHASNLGKLFRPNAPSPLMPNWTHMPIGYHGRASSVIASGQPVYHPSGQVLPPNADTPQFQASNKLDIELEMAFFTGPGNRPGQAIPVDQCEQHIFGAVLMNDWSARDIQKWEYVPLGPFLGKSFATTISPWVVTLDALEPFKVALAAQDPAPLPYLCTAQGLFGYDVQLEVYLQTPDLSQPEKIATSNMKNLYWSMTQQLAHHSVNGCPMRPGDLLASGTISGDEADSYGSLLELTWNGQNPLQLSNGEQRSFLQTGDTIILKGFAEKDGIRVGFGEARGTIVPPA